MTPWWVFWRRKKIEEKDFFMKGLILLYSGFRWILLEINKKEFWHCSSWGLYYKPCLKGNSVIEKALAFCASGPGSNPAPPSCTFTGTNIFALRHKVVRWKIDPHTVMWYLSVSNKSSVSEPRVSTRLGKWKNVVRSVSAFTTWTHPRSLGQESSGSCVVCAVVGLILMLKLNRFVPSLT